MTENTYTNIHITIVGLGYVGLSLAIEFSKKYPTIGFDINEERIKELELKYDRTSQITKKQFEEAKELVFSNEINAQSFTEQASITNVYIITVPTPIDLNKKPDLRPLLTASETIAKVLKQGDIIIYESTVYPGCTEEDCVPVLEKHSHLKFNKGFFCGYSPERINPGDKERNLVNIIKITSGSTLETANFVDELYKSIINAGTYKASSIRVAEAAKLIENCQRDVNISFVNELAIIFDRMNIDTKEVLEAAETKWNFLKFKPGLVGGQCISVDPYYMIYKAESFGYHPSIINAAREINDNMGIFVANRVVKLILKKGISLKEAKVLILGITFKENWPDINNSKVVDIYNELMEFGLSVDIYDPLANKNDVKKEFNIDLIDSISIEYKCIILAVSHDEFLTKEFTCLYEKTYSLIFDIKSVISIENVEARL